MCVVHVCSYACLCVWCEGQRASLGIQLFQLSTLVLETVSPLNLELGLLETTRKSWCHDSKPEALVHCGPLGKKQSHLYTITILNTANVSSIVLHNVTRILQRRMRNSEGG